MQILTEHSLTDLMVRCHRNSGYSAAIIFNRVSNLYNFINEFKRTQSYNGISDFVVTGMLGGRTSIVFDNDSCIDVLHMECLDRARGRRYNDFLLEESVAIGNDYIRYISTFTREYQQQWEIEYMGHFADDFNFEQENKEMDDFLNSFKIYSSS